MRSLTNLPAPVKGLMFMAIAVALIAVMNMCAKLATPYHDPVEKVFYRGVIALSLVVGIMLVRRRFAQFKTGRPFAQLARGTAGTIGLGLVYWSYSLMPMANVTALLFTAGLMTLMISPVALGEEVGIYRWSAVIIGFIGALVVAWPQAEPGFNTLGVIASLSAAFCGGALVAVFLRALGRTESADTTVFYFLSIGLFLTTPYMLLYGAWIAPGALWPLIGTGVAGGLSLLIKTEAYRLTEASLLSPVHYTGIVWAVIFDITIWHVTPSANVIGGATLIIGSNLFILWREQKKKSKIIKGPKHNINTG